MENKNVYDSLSRKRKMKELDKTIQEINKHFATYERIYKSGKYIPKQFFQSVTSILRKEAKTLIENGMEEEKALKKILPKAYAIVKLACKLELGKTYYDVQLMSGIILNDGYVSEMATGEGKTITAALPVYLNALLGKGAHVITPNVYLASRDYEEMKPLYELLGLSCGLVEEMKPSEKILRIQHKADEIIKNETSKRFYNSQELRLLRTQAFESAKRFVNENDIKIRQRQYQCDVTYGSSHAFAFDYLYDLLEDDPKKLRLRLGNPNFLVIDEADAVLFDDAITSYNISGNQKDRDFAITNREKQIRTQYTKLATGVMEYITSHDGYLQEIPDSFEFHKKGEENDEVFHSTTPAIYYCSKTKEFNFTYIGRVIIYQYFCNNEINRILWNNKDRLANMTFKGQPLYSNGRMNINPRLLSLLIQSGKIKELSASFDQFMMNDFQKAYMDITNAGYAWLFLEKDIDYKYVIPKDNRKSENERQIAILMDGRIAEGRVYSNGMQQAVEEKEKVLNKKRGSSIIIKDSEITDTLASIPVAAFFGRYQKFSGMTGTSAKEAFQDLYQLQTFEIPRNKYYKVKDHGDCLYKTTQEKYQAILEDVIKTHKKGQPILLTTTSVGESEKLYQYLMNGLRRNGILVDIPVLNANVDVLRKEARIISKAGKKGAITIATDMAGRGTDIKLGGPHATKEMEEEVLKTGGLKIIGSGHFQYNRSDRQMKGRTGRQGNVGEVVFYNDLEDLRRINVNPKLIENFESMLKRGPIIEEELGTRLIRDVVEKTQEKAESITKDLILYNQRVETPVASCRNQYHDMMERIKLTEDYHKVIEKMQETVLKDIFCLAYDVNPSTEEVNHKAKTSKMDTKLFQSFIREYFGFTIKEEAFQNFKTKEELEHLIQKVFSSRLKRVPVSKELVDSYIHKIWFYFEEYVEEINNQYTLASLIPGNNLSPKMEGQIYEAFMYAYHTVFSQIVREVMNPVRNKQQDHFGIHRLQINSDSTLKFTDTRQTDNNKFYLSDEDPYTKGCGKR